MPTTEVWSTVQEVARRSGLSEATLRYYERVGLVDPVPRDASSGHRRYSPDAVDQLEALGCLRAAGFGLDDMRRYRDRLGARDAAGMRALFEQHVARLDEERRRLETRLAYVQEKVELWTARGAGDGLAEARAIERLLVLTEQL